MLAFISDLHISDRTAGVHFLPLRAFQLTLGEIARQAREANSHEVTLVYLGDIVDLIRTTAWQQVPEAERPWAVPANPERTRSHYARLLEDVVARPENAPIFEFLGGSLEELFGREPRRVYLPGNHDRPCNQFPDLRTRMVELLRLDHDPDVPFPHEFLDARYRTFARHGHEWDPYNIELSPSMAERPRSVAFEEYMNIPIGEVLAAELGSVLHLEIDEALKEVKHLDPAERRAVASQFRAIDDVRPLSAVVPWLFDRLQMCSGLEDPRILQAIDAGLKRRIRYFLDLPFTRDWMRRRDTLNPLDPADKLQFGLGLLEHFSLKDLEWPVAAVLEPLANLFAGDNFASHALSEFRRLDDARDCERQILYVLYGHTHAAAQVPIDLCPPEGDSLDRRARVYLNTGTWRPRYRQTLARNGFHSWKNLTFTLIYHPEIDPKSPAAELGYPSFETWTGSLLEKHDDPQVTS
jgi:UDP-2,3-diacylglucosamine pyrophosphatase LpxH